MSTRRFAAVLALTAAIFSGCAPVAPPAETPAPAPADFPDAAWRQAAAAGQAVYRIDAARSLAAAEVRRGGSLAFFGHDHVVASHGIQGYVAPDAGRADLYLRLDQLVVDEPDLRTEAGFDTRPTAEDIAATRANMLDKVLQAGEHPHLRLRIEGAESGADGVLLDAAITLKGVTRRQRIAAQLESGADTLRVSGRLMLSQRDFGIEPFSLFGGALQVQDALALRFRIEARRLSP